MDIHRIKIIPFNSILLLLLLLLLLLCSCGIPDIVTYFVSGRITGRVLRGRGTTQSGDTPYNIMCTPDVFDTYSTTN